MLKHDRVLSMKKIVPLTIFTFDFFFARWTIGDFYRTNVDERMPREFCKKFAFRDAGPRGPR